MGREKTGPYFSLSPQNLDWLCAFISRWGDLPKDYLSLDLELTGADRSQDLPVEAGWVRVVDCRPIKTAEVVLDWSEYPGVDTQWLSSRMSYAERELRAMGSNYRYTVDFLKKNGRPPERVMRHLLNMLRSHFKKGGHLVGMNLFTLDIPILQIVSEELFGTSFSVPEDQVWDAGAIEKGRLANILPKKNESLTAFFRRVVATRASGVRWSLGVCADRYGLKANSSFLHTALYDALLTHRLLERHRLFFSKAADFAVERQTDEC